MILFFILLGLGAVIAFYNGKLIEYFVFLIEMALLIKMALVAILFFVIGVFLFRPRYYCCRRR